MNLGLDYLTLEQYAQSPFVLASKLERVQQKGFGSHRWRWILRISSIFQQSVLVQVVYEGVALLGSDGLVRWAKWVKIAGELDERE